MFNNTNTWALSPRAIFIRLAFLLVLGVLVVGWIDSTFSPIPSESEAMVHQSTYNSVYPVDSLGNKAWQPSR